MATVGTMKFCKNCGGVFYGVTYSQYCPECRQKKEGTAKK